MPWIILLLSAVLEAVWATALDASAGFTLLAPSLIFLAAGIASMVGLSYAMNSIPISTAYAVWTGLGAVLTVVYAMVSGGEQPGLLKILFLAGIIGCVVGLKFTDAPPAAREPAGSDGETPAGPSETAE
ncbi:multidrug efflux SMR transporter [Arthrobacter sp. zg-Y1219]|uniref:DMT family transporter n=1 Tax=Arthrobacter sp. zg-Y1219 TaxID=3049067 RepID=UPI0024C3987B|nr:multidrug efflux SMR transporter [Arthrobacter sp. zg-Y1219]MDK1361727.1 multidrug efflux SMR transporter [Arthrobacter sp. zg-Y1219]